MNEERDYLIDYYSKKDLHCFVKCLAEKEGVVKNGELQESAYLEPPEDLNFRQQALNKCKPKFANNCESIADFLFCMGAELTKPKVTEPIEEDTDYIQ